MTDIFISYAHEDLETARTLAWKLEQQGLSVWWDRTMLAGADIHHAIEGQLREARKVLVIWSENSVGSRWVRDEARSAADLGKLVPIRVDECILPLGFGNYHTVDIRRLDADIERVLPALWDPNRRPQQRGNMYPAGAVQNPAPHYHAYAAAAPPYGGAQQSADIASGVYLASFGTRFWAGLLDWLAIFGLIMLFAGVVGAFMGAAGGISSQSMERVGELIGSIGFILLLPAYYIVLMSRPGGGQTIGYKIMGLRLANQNSLQTPGMGSTFLWFVVFIFLNSFGFLWIFWDKRKRMLHNIASSTIVVRTRITQKL